MYGVFLLVFVVCLPIATVEIDIHSKDANLLGAFQQDTSMELRLPRMQGWEGGKPSCNWTGITCNIQGHVEALNLSNTGLHGKIHKLAQLHQLVSLDLSQNSLSGQVPSQISNASAMLHLDLSNNNFSGHIPRSFGLLRRLELLNLGFNSLSGRIPMSLSNCSRLKTLSLHENFLSGSIPQELSALSELQTLMLHHNHLTGGLPRSILLNCSTIQGLHLSDNNLSGSIPEEIATLPSLDVLWLNYNNFSGTIPSSIGNLSSLTKLVLTSNKLSGKLPGTLGRLSKLTLGLFGLNFFTGGFPVELTNVTGLVQLRLYNNGFTGHIPEQIGNLRSLIALFLNSNFFSGPIPSQMFNCSKLDTILLQNNHFDGTLPFQIGRLTSLGTLNTDNNRLSGRIPDSLRNCTRLQDLTLGYNRLTGEIPWAVAGISTLVRNFSVAGNMLTGKIPPSIASLDLVLSIDLSGNKLTGSIPSAISACTGLTLLNLSGNSLQGSIPELLKLQSLSILDISNNNLTGAIPFFLGTMKSLKFLNLSNNMLEGPIPSVGVLANLSSSSFLGNPRLCGWPLQNPCSTGPNHSARSVHHLHFMPYFLVGIVLLITCIALVLILGIRICLRTKATNPVEPVLEVPELVKLDSRELRSATEDFNPSNIIGAGSSSIVYKGMLNSTTSAVAVKVLTMKDTTIIKAELEALARIRHRNLVKLVGYCLQPDLNALVLQLFTGGTLHHHIHSKRQEAPEWEWLLETAKGVAQGLKYLHHECGDPPVLHCDLKPSNILFDEDMVPHLADFGIARASVKQSLTTSNFKGTIGYAAPECASLGRISTKSDVYSYGIVLLEMLTRTKPTDERFGHGMTLSKWVAQAVACDNALDICIKPRGSSPQTMLRIVKLALSCSHDVAKQRPDIKQVSFTLHDI